MDYVLRSAIMKILGSACDIAVVLPPRYFGVVARVVQTIPTGESVNQLGTWAGRGGQPNHILCS